MDEPLRGDAATLFACRANIHDDLTTTLTHSPKIIPLRPSR